MAYEAPMDDYERWKDEGKPGGSYTPDWKGNIGTGEDPAVKEGLDAYRRGERGSDPSKVPGYGDMGAWRQWYAQQQGGTRPEDMARFSDATLAGWDPYLVKQGQYAGKYRSMRGAEGYFDKPTECPPGMVPSGPDEDDPCVLSSSMAGPGGQWGDGGKGGFGGGSAWDNPIYQFLKGQALGAAQDPTGQKAMKMFMGQGFAGQFQQQIDSIRQQAQAMPPGPARDALLARIPEIQAGLQTGMQHGANKNVQDILSGQLMPQEYQYVGLGENARQANMQNKLGWGNLDLSRELGLGNLDLANRQFGWESGKRWEDILRGQKEDRDLSRWSLSEQIKANKPSKFQQILGGVGSIVGLGAGLFGGGAGLVGGLSSLFGKKKAPTPSFSASYSSPAAGGSYGYGA